jgi:hypothetical protein
MRLRWPNDPCSAAAAALKDSTPRNQERGGRLLEHLVRPGFRSIRFPTPFLALFVEAAKLAVMLSVYLVLDDKHADIAPRKLHHGKQTRTRSRLTIRISCWGRLQDLRAARKQDGGPGQLHPLVLRLLFAQHKIDHPAAAHMSAVSHTVSQDCLVVAPGIRQGVRQGRHGGEIL